MKKLIKIQIPAAMTLGSSGRMANNASHRNNNQNKQATESFRVRYTSGPKKHTKAGHVVTFNSQKSFTSNTSKDSSEDEEEYISSSKRVPGKGSPSSVNVDRQNFDVIKTLHEGKYSKILLAKLDGSALSKERMVLKAVEAVSTSSVHMFYREMDYNYLLSPHENVVTSYNVVLRWKNYYIFAQEYANVGDLGRYLKKFGALSETKTKSVLRQLSSALDFIHGLNLVHQAVLPENILVFNRECTLVKLSDFCGMRPSGTLVMKGNLENSTGEGDDDSQQSSSSMLAYTPPEICTKLPQEKYHVHPSIDVWAVGIIIWAGLSGTGKGPWQSADMLRDFGFRQFYEWTKKKSLKVPDAFQPFSPRLLRLIKKLLEPKPEKRCKAREVLKYLKDDWVSSVSSKNTAAVLSKLGMSRSESCTFGSSGTLPNGALAIGGFGRTNSQRYARRGSVCPRAKSEVRRMTKRQESNSSGNNNSVSNSPRPTSKSSANATSASAATPQGPPSSQQGGDKGAEGNSINASFKMSCVLETTRVVPLSTSKSASCIPQPPPSPTPLRSTLVPLTSQKSL